VEADDLETIIDQLKAVPKMIPSLKQREELRLELGGKDIKFGLAPFSSENIEFASNGYYVTIDGFIHNSDTTLQSAKQFASGFAQFLTELLERAKNSTLTVNDN
jgi:hypothetical protein